MLVTIQDLYYNIFDLHTDHFFPICWKMLAKIASNLTWINTVKNSISFFFLSLHNPLVWTPFQKLLGDHLRVSLEKNGDHFGVDLENISG